MINKGMMSSNTDLWSTPQATFDALQHGSCLETVQSAAEYSLAERINLACSLDIGHRTGIIDICQW